MKIAFVSVGRYPSPVHVGGGDVRHWQNLEALRSLGHEISLITVDPNNAPNEKTRQQYREIHTLRSKSPSFFSTRFWKERIYNPETLQLLEPDLRGSRTSLQTLLEKIEPDLVWAEGAFALSLVSAKCPIVHSQVDFMHKLRPVRQTFAKKLRRPDPLSLSELEGLEYSLFQRATHTICASYTEALLCKEHGIAARYIPVSLPWVAAPDFSNLSEPRFVLFGNPNTAMRATREHLREKIWPIVERRGLRFDWHQVGKIPSEGRDPNWKWLQKHFTIHGYADDLAKVLRPGDASIMPYPFDTGGRAKFAVAAGYGMVNIAYDLTFACAHEFHSGQDCLSARDPDAFVDAMQEYQSDLALRLRLAKNSRALFESVHQLQAQLPIYEEVLRDAFKKPQN